MDKNITINVHALQSDSTGEVLDLSQSMNGQYFYKDGHNFLYEETDPDDGSVTKCALKVCDNRVFLSKSGNINANMTFETGLRSKFDYNTPYGRLVLEIDTAKVTFLMSENHARISLQYDLLGEGILISKNRLDLNVSSHEQ